VSLKIQVFDLIKFIVNLIIIRILLNSTIGITGVLDFSISFTFKDNSVVLINKLLNIKR